MTIRETMKWKELQHRHILPFLGLYIQTDASPTWIYMVSLHIEGFSLSDYIKHNQPEACIREKFVSCA
jgi:hypothetical protein